MFKRVAAFSILCVCVRGACRHMHAQQGVPLQISNFFGIIMVGIPRSHILHKK